ncbi:hypothetical protein Pla123a_03950 [Posidoniimonas polymericola]|uniref:Uncharacterized protein n=1 Tax=Posidoniimonas polymericola TaxID=2528002 RepID=A0A5C5ZEK4_9BACT|nr:hypothetical protein [Posidoniimonas polymericola]TWT85588.1 hypothetical protein Pla123a_03950 [Posidoniimonas polymericola]
MTVLNAEADFASVIDGLQSVTVQREAGGSVVVAAARLVSRAVGEEDSSGGGVLIEDLVWDLPWPDGAASIDVGDEIEHGASGSCVVLRVEQRGPGVRYRCTARDVTISDATSVLVDLESPVWEDLGSGPEITGWTTIAADVPAHIQPAVVEHDYSGDPTVSASTFTVSCEAVDDLELCERVVAADGAEYRVDRVLDDGRIDKLPVLEVTQTVAAS